VVDPLIIYSAVAGVASLVGGAVGSRFQFRQQSVQSIEPQMSDAVRTALSEATGKIKALEEEVSTLNVKINTLHTLLTREQSNSQLLRNEITNLRKKISIGDLDDLVIKPPDAVVISNLKTGVINYASEGVFFLLGYTPNELIGQDIDTLVPEDLRKTHIEERAEYNEHPRARPMGSGINLLARKREGDVIPVDIQLSPTDDGRVVALIRGTLRARPEL
jgi:PAS domain S-box-containing protein